MVAQACNPSYLRWSWFEAIQGKEFISPYLNQSSSTCLSSQLCGEHKQEEAKRAGRVAQVIECLPNKCEALNLNSSISLPFSPPHKTRFAKSCWDTTRCSEAHFLHHSLKAEASYISFLGRAQLCILHDFKEKGVSSTFTSKWLMSHLKMNGT
jgi:hypothetical protein